MRTLSSHAESTTPGSTGRPDTSLPAKATDTALVVHLQAPALRRVSLGDDRYLQDVAATLTHGPEGWRAIDLAARIPDAFVQHTRAARHTADQPQQTNHSNPGLSLCNTDQLLRGRTRCPSGPTISAPPCVLATFTTGLQVAV
jgi:hypothetical protein